MRFIWIVIGMYHKKPLLYRCFNNESAADKYADILRSNPVDGESGIEVWRSGHPDAAEDGGW